MQGVGAEGEGLYRVPEGGEAGVEVKGLGGVVVM